MEKSFCPTLLHVRAKLRLGGFLTAEGCEVTPLPKKVILVQEEGSVVSAQGLFEKLILTGEEAGLYLNDVPPAFRPPFTVSFVEAPQETRTPQIVGLEIVREGKMQTKDRYGRFTRGFIFTEVKPIIREL